MDKKPIAELTLFLQATLTQRLTAYCLGIDNGTTVGQWARSESNPSSSMQIKIKKLNKLVQDLSKNNDAGTIQAWFLGLKPSLCDNSPAKYLHDNFDKNFQAVKFLADYFIIRG